MTTLSVDEMQRCRRECDANVLDIGAEPYFWHVRVFDIIRTNVSSSATAATTATTTATAAGAITITVASATGLVVGEKIRVDCDGFGETCTIKSISGTTVGINATKVHSGTFPVEPESALTMVRALLYDLSSVQDQINTARSVVGIKRADETEFFGPSDGGGVAAQLREEQRRLRNDLTGMLNLREIARAGRGGGGGDVEAY